MSRWTREKAGDNPDLQYLANLARDAGNDLKTALALGFAALEPARQVKIARDLLDTLPPAMRAAILGDVVLDADIWESVKQSTAEAEHRPKVIQALVERGRSSRTINLAHIPADTQVSMRLHQHLSWHKEVPPAELQTYAHYIDVPLRALGDSTFETTRDIYNAYDENGAQAIIALGSPLQLLAHDPYSQPTEVARYHRSVSALHDGQSLSFRYTDSRNRNPDYTPDPCILGDIALDGQSVFIES